MIRKPSFTDSIFTSFISIAFSIGILGGIIALGLKYYLPISGRVTVTAALSYIDPLVAEIYTFYALNDRWPTKKEEIPMLQDDVYTGRGGYKISLDNGSLHIVVNSSNQDLDGRVISFRKAIFPNQKDATMLWLCGYQPIPDGMVVDTENRTNIDKKYMITRCK